MTGFIFKSNLRFEDSPKAPGDVETFVEYGNFSIAALEQVDNPRVSIWDKPALEIDRSLRERYWRDQVSVSFQLKKNEHT